MSLETIRVVTPVVDGNPYGYVVINKADMTEGHVLFDDAHSEKAPASSEEADDGKGMTVAEIKAALDEAGLAYPPNAKKAELLAIFDAATKK